MRHEQEMHDYQRRAVAHIIQHTGAGVILGPGMNIYRNSQCGRNFEYMGEDPYLVASLIGPYVEGMQSTGTLACAKHFLANQSEFYRRRSNSIVDERAIMEIYTPAFKAAIDAGANIVWGHHPHVLQPIEEYNGGIIYYSLGNFAFGGNSVPKDHDTAVLQQEIIREPDGSIHLGKLTIIPCSVSSIKERNNFQPTPYEEGSEEYKRVLSKLDGTYGGPNLASG